jgi:hypothetical protein
MRVRQVNEAIAAQNQVCSWQPVVDEIDLDKPPTLPTIETPVSRNQVGNDIAAGVLNIEQLDIAHPEKIAAWDIEEGSALQFRD